MQFQPVIDVAPDGQSAKMRSRALSIMGQWQRYSQWMGGVVRERLRQRERRLEDQARSGVQHVFRAVHGGLEGRDAAAAARQITESNPPDAPPTHPFEMYPRPFLPPFHYPNPSPARRSPGRRHRERLAGAS